MLKTIYNRLRAGFRGNGPPFLTMDPLDLRKILAPENA